MSIDPAEFRRILGHFATGVTVLTTHHADGRPTGLTANAFCSVSLTPPLVLVCIDKNAESYTAFGESRVFCVNFLTQHQETLSRRFAKHGGEKFDGVGFRAGSAGCAILDGALGYLECQIRQEIDAGDHTIYLGEALDAAAGDDGEPLLYYRGGYRRLGS